MPLFSLPVLFLLLAGVWGAALYQIHSKRDAILLDSQNRTQRSAQAFGEYTFSNAQRLSDYLIDLRTIWLSDRASFAALVAARQQNTQGLIFQVAVIDSSGHLAWSSIDQDSVGMDLSQRAHFRYHQQSPKQDNLYISDPVKGKVSGKWSLQFTRPILRNGQFDGVVVLSVDPAEFARFATFINTGSGGIRAVVKDSGKLIVRLPELSAGLGLPVETIPGNAIGGHVQRKSTLDGINRIIGYYRVPQMAMTFLVGESLNTLLQPYKSFRQSALEIAVLITLLLLVVYYILLRYIKQGRRHIAAMRLTSLVYTASSEAMIITTHDGKILEVNPAFHQLTDYSPEEVQGRQGSDFLFSDDPGQHPAMLPLTTQDSWQGECLVRRKDKTEFPAWLSIDAFTENHGDARKHVVIIRDMTEKRRAEVLIWRQANFDPLTDLPNRRMFYASLSEVISYSAKTTTPFTLLFIDLDRFKDVNDRLGHNYGDLLLKKVATRLQNAVRKEDIVSRLAGDEFTIILRQTGERPEIEALANNILRELILPFPLYGERVYISASIGIAIYPDNCRDGEALLIQADQAMLYAKKSGRSQFCFFNPQIQKTEEERLWISNDMYAALEDKQFSLRYQPVFDIRTEKLCKAEALLRWDHPTRGNVPPGSFIPVAEETGLIIDIGHWVFREVLSQLQAWQPLLAPGFQISVNKSPTEFHANRKGGQSWPAILAEYDLPHGCIIAEITENSLLKMDDEIRAHLALFHQAGISIALDDFGTGFSSLTYLRQLSIDYIKIDRAFIHALTPGNTEDIDLCKAIISLAHSQHIQVVAEGIETQEQLDILRQINCDYGQGYWLSPPLDKAEFTALITRQKIEYAHYTASR